MGRKKRVSANGQTTVSIAMNVPFALTPNPCLSASKRLPRQPSLSPDQGSLRSKGRTSVILENMLPWLDLFPNREMAQLIRSGFHVPQFDGEGCLFTDNLQSVQLNLGVVRAKLASEVSEGRMTGPFASPPFRSFRVYPLGLDSKKEPNSFCLIHHLSFPGVPKLCY